MKNPLLPIQEEKYEDEEEESNISSSILLKSNEESTCFPKGSLASSIWILSSVSLGVGIFVQPSIFYHIGYVSGSAIVILFAVVTCYSQYLFLLSCNGKTYPSYGACVQSVLGKIGLAFSSVFMAITCFIANAAHMSTVSKMLKDIMSWFFTGDYDCPISKTKNAILIAVLLAFVSPFCFKSDSLSALRHIGTVSFFTSAILAVSMIVLGLKRLVDGDEVAEHTPAFVWDAKEILSGSAALCFAYVVFEREAREF